MTLSDTTSENPSFTAPNRLTNYTLVFSLVVSDGVADSAADTVTIAVQADNDPPTANAGPDQTVVVGDTVTLDGRASSDPEGEALSYQLEYVAVAVAGSDCGVPAVDPDSGGVADSIPCDRVFGRSPAPATLGAYEFSLRVTAGGVSSDDQVVITVVANSPPGALTLANQTATAGTAFSYQFGEVTDPNGHTVSYSAELRTGGAGTESDPWTYGSLPSWLTFTSDTRTFSCDAAGSGACEAGTYTIRVTASDDASPPATSLGGVHADRRLGVPGRDGGA